MSATESDKYWSALTHRYASPLDPLSRLSEVVFGLIMVLTFTCSVGAATAGREEIATMLWAALGCNTAWGIVDAFMILMAIFYERSDALQTLRRLNKAGREEAEGIIRDRLPGPVSEVMRADEISNLHERLKALPEPPARVIFTWQDIRNAIRVFFIVFLSTFPVAVPFIIVEDAAIALRVSNGIALILLFVAGLFIGRMSGYRPFLVGVLFALIGAGLVLLTMYLGG